MEKLYLKDLIEKLKLRLDSYSFNELKAIILEYAFWRLQDSLQSTGEHSR